MRATADKSAGKPGTGIEAAPDEAPGGAAAKPDRAAAPEAAGLTLDRFLREQERLLAERPADAALQRLVTLLHLAREDWPAAAQAAGRLAPRDDTWRLVAAALESRVGQNAEAAALLEEVRRRWRAAAPLAVRRAALCSRIAGFGDFQAYPPGRAFSAHDPEDGLLVYLEIDHAVLDLLPDGRTRLSLHYDFELLDAAGQAVPTPAWEAYNRDDVRTLAGYVNDVHSKLRLYLPEGLTKGAYTLNVRVTDRIGRKQAAATVELQVR
jgi:hypothetical protein